MMTGKPEASGWREKALAAGVIVERLGNASASSRKLTKYGITKAVIWKPNQSSKKSDREGGLSQGRSPFRFAVRLFCQRRRVHNPLDVQLPSAIYTLPHRPSDGSTQAITKNPSCARVVHSRHGVYQTASRSGAHWRDHMQRAHLDPASRASRRPLLHG